MNTRTTFALLFASAVAAGLWLLRFLYSGSLAHAGLLWNLFLAWMPLLAAVQALRQRRAWGQLAYGSLWLLFLPNAPYLLTNVARLGWGGRALLWYDLIMLLAFAFTGLLLGFTSLILLQGRVAQKWGGAAGWLFAAAALGLSSFGVYLGRFLRWNSWDLLLRPSAVLRDVLAVAAHPLTYWRPWAFTLLLATILAFTYAALLALPRLLPAVRTGRSEHPLP